MYSEVILLLLYLHLASLDKSTTFLGYAQGICRSIKGNNHNLNLPLSPIAACSTTNLSPAQVQGKGARDTERQIGIQVWKGS